MNNSSQHLGDQEPTLSHTPDISTMKSLIAKAVHEVLESSGDDLELQLILEEFINSLKIDSATLDIRQNLDLLLSYLFLENKELSELSAKLVCILMYKNELMQRHILSLKSFLKIGPIIFFNLPVSYDENMIKEVEKLVMGLEKRKPKICYVYPAIDNFQFESPEKIIECSIDTMSSFVGFHVNSDSLEKLLEGSSHELPPITELSSTDRDSRTSLMRNSELLQDVVSEKKDKTPNSLQLEPKSAGKTLDEQSFQQEDSSKRQINSILALKPDELSKSNASTYRHSSIAVSDSDPILPDNLKHNPKPVNSSHNEIVARGIMPRLPSPEVSQSTQWKRSNSTSFPSPVPKDRDQSQKKKRVPSAIPKANQQAPNSHQNKMPRPPQLSAQTHRRPPKNPSLNSSLNHSVVHSARVSGSAKTRARSGRDNNSSFDKSFSRPGSRDTSLISPNQSMFRRSRYSQNTSLPLLEEETPKTDEQLNTPLSKEVYYMLKRTENGKYINYLEKLQELDKPQLADQEYLNPLLVNTKKNKMSSTKKHFIENYSFNFDLKAQMEAGKKEKEPQKYAPPIDKMLYLRLSPRTISHHKWRSHPTKNRVIKEPPVIIPEVDYKFKPPPTKGVYKRKIPSDLGIEALRSQKLDDDLRVAVIEDQFKMDVKNDLDVYLSNILDVKKKNDKVYGTKISYYNDVMKYYDSKHQDKVISTEAIKLADEEVDFVLKWKQGKAPVELDPENIPKEDPDKKKKKSVDPTTQQEEYFPRKPAFIPNSGLMVSDAHNGDDPLEILTVKRQNSNKKPRRGLKLNKRTYPLLDSSPELSLESLERSNEKSPQISPARSIFGKTAGKSQADVFDFKIELNPLNSTTQQEI